MKLTLCRYGHGEDSTGGLLFINDEFFCYTCEDEWRQQKVYGETRIPEGTYRITLRDAGGMNQRYRARFPWHQGMVWLRDVPNFEWIYIHYGNTDDDTEGCILIGYEANCNDKEYIVGDSVNAYSDLYQYILLALDRGEDLEIEVKRL